MIPDRLLNARLIVLERTSAPQEWGGEETWRPVCGPLACRIQPISAREIVDGKVRTGAEYVVYLPIPPCPIGEEDRVEVDGLVYQVVFVKDAAGAHHHLELEVKRP